WSTRRRRCGWRAAEGLAPAPYVDDEPTATITSGAPLAKRLAVRISGWTKRLSSAGALQTGAGAAGWSAAFCAGAAAGDPANSARADTATTSVARTAAPNTIKPSGDLLFDGINALSASLRRRDGQH